MHTRRQFVMRLGGLGLAGVTLGLAGCDQASDRLVQLLAPDDARAPRPPIGAEVDDVTHVLNRLTFGPRPEDRARVLEMGVDAYIEEQLHPAALDDRACEWRVAEIEGIHAPREELYEYPVERLMLDLARARLVRAIRSRRQLYEVLVDTWTDHFNIGIRKGECKWMKVADDRETIRAHALGKFRDMVAASLASPAMLISLDGLDNRVVHPEDHPNENHARELLELHTLGVDGGYTQRDVLETARCLSGWTFEHDWRKGFTARVRFEPSRHDQGAKEVLGVAIPAGGGEDDIQRILDIVCRHPSTARHVARRLCRTLVDDPAPEAVVAVAAERFMDTDGDLAAVVRAILASPEFNARRGTLLKRPMHFVVSALRALDARTTCGPELLDHLERMGHAPFQCPTPDGYALEPAPWLGTLLWRWTLAMQLAENRVPDTRVDLTALVSRFGEGQPAREALLAHLIGRTPTAPEREALGDGPTAVALALASPAFQWH
jgi:uncharacterized protein (DUF1800 family)